MKKLSYLFFALGLISVAASCNKETELNEMEASSAPTSFLVSSPETKTTLDGLHVRWASGDEIRVYGHNTSTDTYTDNAVYELTSGAGEGTGTFTLKEGETGLSGTYDEYYAVYPGTQTLTISGTPLKMRIAKLAKTQTAVENGFNPSFAIMTAKYDGSRLVFHHGAGYIKFVLSEDSVTSVAINLGSNCLVQQPTYLASDGSYSVGASGYSTVTVSGDFVKGSAYYIPVIPRPDDTSKKISNLIITCTGGSTFTTAHFNDKVVEIGKVFDLGTLAKGPYFTAADVTIEADDQAGSIEFIVSNLVDGGAVTGEVLAGATISNLSLGAVSFNSSNGEGSVSFTCDENTGSAKTATVRLTYTYNTDKTVTKDVKITQKAASGSSGEDYVWDFSSTEWQDAMNTQAPGAKDAKASNWTVLYDGLAYNAGKDDRWSVNGYIQPNGSGYYKTSDKRRYFLFTTTGGGYVYVTVRSNSSSDKTAAVCAQLGEKNSADFSESVTSTAGSDTVVELGPFTEGGDVAVFLDNGGHRIYKVEFHTTQQ